MDANGFCALRMNHPDCSPPAASSLSYVCTPFVSLFVCLLWPPYAGEPSVSPLCWSPGILLCKEIRALIFDTAALAYALGLSNVFLLFERAHFMVAISQDGTVRSLHIRRHGDFVLESLSLRGSACEFTFFRSHC